MIDIVPCGMQVCKTINENRGNKIAKVREVRAEKDSHWPLLLKKATVSCSKRGSNSVLETKPQRDSTTSKIAAMWPARLHLRSVEALPDG